MEELIKKQEIWAKEMKLKALDMALSTGFNGSHIGGGFSAMEIYSVLYSEILNVGPNVKEDIARDRIIASKDLSLNSLSDMVRLSPNYISRIF